MTDTTTPSTHGTGINSILFRYRLAVMFAAFALAIIAGIYSANHDIASLMELVGKPHAFLATGLVLVVSFVFRVSGESRLGSVVYGQGAGARVITSGPYRFTRNPLYIGTWLFFSATIAPYLPPVVLVTFAIAFGLVLRAMVLHEERDMTAAFGDAFTRYAAAVPRFIGLPRAVDSGDDGVRVSPSALALAAFCNLFFLSLGLYRLAWFVNGGTSRAADVANVICFLLWIGAVVVRRVRLR